MCRPNVAIQGQMASPFFVTGASGSGVSLLCSIVRRLLNVSFDAEVDAIVRVHRRLARYGDLRDLANLGRLIDQLIAERSFQKLIVSDGFVIHRERILQQPVAGAMSYSILLRAIFEQLREYQGTSGWGARANANDGELSILRHLFPEARFVHVVRDGRDVAVWLRDRRADRRS